MTKAWPEVALGDVVQLLAGFAFDAAQFSDGGGTPLIRIRDVTRGRTKTFFDGGYDQRYVVNDGEILIGMDGQFNRARWKGGPALLNQRVCKITSSSGSLENDYLFHFLPQALKSVEDETPFVTVKHLSMPKLKSIKIPLPPLDEQRRIAAILDKADEVRSKRKAALETLETLSQAIFIEMFGDPTTNPMGWEKRSLGDFCDDSVIKLGRGNVISKIDIRGNPGPYPIYSSARENQGKFGEYGAYMFDEEMITWSVDGGGALFHRRKHKFSVTNVGGTLRILDERIFNYTFLHALLSLLHSKITFDWVTKAHPSVIRRLYVDVVIPPLSAQESFSRAILEVRTGIQRSLSGQMAESELFASLQQKAFQGEL